MPGAELIIKNKMKESSKGGGAGVELQRVLKKKNRIGSLVESAYSTSNAYLNKMITAECVFSKQVLAAEFLTSNDRGALNELRNALNGLAFKCHWNLDKNGMNFVTN